MTRSLAPTGRLLLIYGALSLTAVALGAWICVASGLPPALWVRNLAAWLVGAVAACGLARISGAQLFPIALIGACIALAATLFGPGQLGVHRWIGLGPLNINVAMLLLPPSVVALAVAGRDALWPWLLAFGGLVVLVVQPDASQATALGVAMIWIAGRTVKVRAVRVAIVLGVGLAMVSAWLRPDPLQPVPEVEEILRLAYARSPALAALALAVLIMLSAAPAVLARRGARGPAVAGGAVSLYLLACAAAPFVGAFPVPLVGVGLSPVLGAWLGVGVLAGALRRPAGES